MDRRYFGTDGVRGRVGTAPITPDFVMRLGWAAGRVMARQGRGRVLVGKDTRVSGYMFESALEAGLSAAGMDIRLLGPMPTPAIAYLTRALRAHLGIVISASHNSYEDNGIKFFSTEGTKLADEVEHEIERELDLEMATVESRDLGKASRLVDAPGRYIEFCKATVPAGLNLRGLRVVLDCANGATYQVAPKVFDELGCNVTAIGVRPDGFNINDGFGSTHPDRLQAAVREQGADIGIAFDGDGDRVILADHRGVLVDGDQILFAIAAGRHAAGTLQGPVIGTVMSNLGLEIALRDLGVPLQRAKVGDRYVFEMLQRSRSTLGGESSGHIICLDRTTTGDGIVAALQVVSRMVLEERPLAEIVAPMSKFPQRLVNVRLARRIDVLGTTGVRDAVASAERMLGDKGRVLLRPSGTEPLVRVMVEGDDPALVDRLAEGLATAVREAIATAS